MKTSCSVVLLFSWLVFASASVRADDWVNPYTGNHWNNPTSSLIDSMIRDQMNANMLARSLANQRVADPGTAASAPVKHAPYTKTDFKGGKRRLVVAAIIASLAPTPEQQTAFGTAIDQVFVAFEKEARKNNVAYALAFMVAAAISVDRNVTVSDEQSEELAAGINDLLAKMPGFAKAKASDRQKLYETFVTMGGLILVFAEVGKQGDGNSTLAAQVLAKEALALVGVK